MTKRKARKNSIKDTKKHYKEYISDMKKILKASRRILGLVYKCSPWNTIGLLVTVIITATLPFISAWFTSKIIDELILQITSTAEFSSDIVFYMVIVFLFFILNSVIGTLTSYFDLNLFFAVALEMDRVVTKKLSELDIEYYENPNTNDTIQKVRDNYGHKPQGFTTDVFWTIESLIRIISGATIIVAFSPVLLLILTVATLPELINNVVFGRRSWGIWGAKAEVKRDYHRTKSHLTHEDALMEIRIFKSTNYMLQRVQRLFQSFQDERLKVERKRSGVNMTLGIISAFGFGTVFVITILAVLAKRITVGQFNFYISTARQVQGGLSSFFRRIARLYEDGLYIVDIFEVLDMKVKLEPGTKTLEKKTEPPLIQFQNVMFKYPGTERVILENFNLEINPGENVALVGENGAGKTTIIKLLMRFYDPTEGKILIDGIDLKEISYESWYKKVATLFQEFNTYHFEAKTNIGIGDIEKVSEINEIVEAAKKSGADEFIQKYENKYDQILDKGFSDGIRPSWGQWQRIALARAFFKDAPVLILDEPTSAIDPKAEFEIFERLFDFAKHKTVLIISHRFSTVRNAKRILVIESGKIIEQGSHEDLMEIENGKYKVAFELQKRGYE